LCIQRLKTEMEMNWWRCLVATVMVAAAVGCAGPQASVHEAIKGGTQEKLPRKVLLLPPDIRVHELSVGGVAEKAGGSFDDSISTLEGVATVAAYATVVWRRR
jgi:hypothetical protein